MKIIMRKHCIQVLNIQTSYSKPITDQHSFKYATNER